MRYRAVIFDLDGTLVHSAPDLHAAASRMLADLGRPDVTLEQVTGFVGNGVPKLVERCLTATGGVPGDGGAEALRRFSDHYARAATVLTRPYPGVATMLAALQAAGMAMAICTNKPEGPARSVLADLGLAAFFGSVVGGDTLPVRKPEPAVVGRCLADLGIVPDAAVYVGDSETDAATAEGSGLPFALYTGGYRKTPVADLPHAFAFDRFDDLADGNMARVGCVLARTFRCGAAIVSGPRLLRLSPRRKVNRFSRSSPG